MRVPPVTGENWQVWAEDMRKHVGRVQTQLSDKSPDASAREDGVILFDRVNGYPVYSYGGAWVPLTGGSGATGGSATLDFGAAPGSSVASIAVTGQTGILSGSRIHAWVQGSTADHNEYEHSRILPGRVGLGIGDIVAGTGFTIHAETEMRLTGDVSVKWEWA